MIIPRWGEETYRVVLYNIPFDVTVNVSRQGGEFYDYQPQEAHISIPNLDRYHDYTEDLGELTCVVDGKVTTLREAILNEFVTLAEQND